MKAIYTQPLHSGCTYHVFNQGNNGEDLFKAERNYFYFLQKYQEFIVPVAHTYAWCLLPNHFHFLIQFKDYQSLHEYLPKRFPAPPTCITKSEDIATSEEVAYNELVSYELSRQFANFFSGYTRAVNNAYNRRGKLFSVPFGRIQVQDERYFEWLICYIHRNPIHHGFCKNFEQWNYTSYHEINGSFDGDKIADNTQSTVSNLIPKLC
ncbi:MAG: transposase, partial [Saprospiraceae bacterium]